MRDRPAKRPRLEDLSSSEEEEDKEEAHKIQLHDQVGRRPKTAPPRVPEAFRQPLADRTEEEWMDGPTEKEAEDEVPFCCKVCKCFDNRKERVEYDECHQFSFFEDGFGCWHRRCCHGQYKLNDENYSLPFQRVCMLKNADLEQRLLMGDAAKQDEKNPGWCEWVTLHEIKQNYNAAKTFEAKLYNDDSEVDMLSKLQTSEDYVEGVTQPFERIKQLKTRQQVVTPVSAMNEDEKDAGITVLDCFAGIGTGAVVLKRLGIKIKTVVHVEHDKVATHVYRQNHDPMYNQELSSDGIRHVYIQKFEKIDGWDESEAEEKKRKGLEKLWKKVGNVPIDLVLGGPPCVDYSAVNAFREGAEGEQGQYLVRFGRFIRYLERMQNLRFGENNPFFFLAENVILQGDDLEKVSESFGFSWDPYEFDALYLSPTKRRRHFFSNIPLSDFDYGWEDSSIEDCLEPGFVPPANIVDKNTTMKANCFMASPTRIDERRTLRMYVFNRNKVEGNGRQKSYLGRPMTASERELAMGFTKGYVEKPTKDLFNALLKNGHECPKNWRKQLDPKYHCFAGNYHDLPDTDPYKFTYDEEDGGEIQLQMSPPPTGKSPTFYDYEEYSKHLIGNAYSVPAVEFLLRPLTEIFTVQQYYPNFTYDYAWEETKEQKKPAVATKIESQPREGGKKVMKKET